MKRLTLAGSTTVITGAASGMGAEIARLLAARGVHLALVDHNAEALADVAAELPTTATLHVVDLRDDDAVFAAVDRITDAHPRINALITCAGSSMLGTLDQLTMEEMRWLSDVNLWGTVSITKALLPALRAAPAAHITHLASVYALAAPAGRIPYALSKFAVRGFSEALRHELEGTTVTVGAVYPAGVRTGCWWAPCHCTSSSRPSWCSTSALRLSTQSPSLQYSVPSISRISARWMWPQTTPW